MKGARSGVMRVIFALMATAPAKRSLRCSPCAVDVGRLGHYYPAVLTTLG